MAYENELYRVPESLLQRDLASAIPPGMRHVDGLEDMFGLIESSAAPLLDWVDDYARLPSAPGDMEDLLWFLLMLESRNPDRLERMRQMEEHLANLHAKTAAFNDPSLFGGPVPKLTLPMAYNRPRMVGKALKIHESLMPYMLARKWTLYVSTVSEPLVCADIPLGIDMLGPANDWFGGPAHGVSGTMVTVPLSRSLLLTGRFEGLDGVRIMDHTVVALANTLAFNRAERFVYAESVNFPVLSIPRGGTVLEALQGRYPVKMFPLVAFRTAGAAGQLRKPHAKVDFHMPDFLDRPREEFFGRVTASDSGTHTGDDDIAF